MDSLATLFDVHFIRPWWLWALPVALVIPVAWRYLRRPSGDWSKVCDPHLLRWLSVGESSNRSGKVGSLVAALALACGALALSGPSWQRLPDTAYSARDARVVVLDLSLSMLAEDLRPNRLTQARYRLSDMLEETLEGQMGLVAYAGDAYVVSPLTSDTNTIANMLPALQPDIIPVGGSRADRALELAAELFERAGIARGEILLVSDEAGASDAEAAARLAARGIMVSVLAVGTVEGAPIPSGNGFVSDGNGNVVIARVTVEQLRAVARAGGGRFSRLDTFATRESPWNERDGSEFALRDDTLGERWKDSGPFLVLLLLPLTALGFRRGLLFLLPLVLVPGLMHSQPAQAGLWEDLWQRRDQQAQAALQEQKPAEAANLAKNPQIAGEAWYRSEDYERAVEAWAQQNQADTHYNRGNALAKAGQLDQALAAYDQALALQPDMEDALFNRALVEQLKQQQDQQNQQDQDDSEGQEGQQGEQQPSDQQGEEGEQQEGEEAEEGEQQEQPGEQGEQPSQEQLAQNWSEEDAQAMEQWLRRIPDDPGGLLRRKFRNQHQRRGAPEDERESW